MYMSKTFFDLIDLRKFRNITECTELFGSTFFDFYRKVFEKGTLTVR